MQYTHNRKRGFVEGVVKRIILVEMNAKARRKLFATGSDFGLIPKRFKPRGNLMDEVCRSGW